MKSILIPVQLQYPDQDVDEVEIKAETTLQMVCVCVLVHLDGLVRVVSGHRREQSDSDVQVSSEERGCEGWVAKENGSQTD